MQKIRVYFNTISVLASYNLDLPKNLHKMGMDIIIEILHPLLYLIYQYDKKKLGYKFSKVLPPYLSKILRRNMFKHVDIVHMNSFDLDLARKAKNMGKPIIFVLHAAPFSEQIYGLANDYVDIYVAPSNFTLFQERTKITKPITVIYHGIDTEIFNPSISREHARRILGLPLKAKIILWNDRISPEKDLETFLEASEIILKEVKDVFIYVKGRAVVKNYYDRIKSKLKVLRESGRFKLHLGWIPQSKLPLLYRATDIFVRTSKYENFGLGVIESMACETPPIAPNWATFPEIIGNSSLLYKPQDHEDLAHKVIMLLESPDFYNRTIRYISERVKTYFDMKIIAKQYIDLYYSLL